MGEDTSSINFSEYEIAPLPRYETPYQFILGETGENLDTLKNFDGRELAWNEVEQAGMMEHVQRIFMLRTRVNLVLRKKDITE